MENNFCNFCKRALTLSDLKQLRGSFICLECLTAAEVAAGVKKENKNKSSAVSCIIPILIVLAGLAVDAEGHVLIGSIGIIVVFVVWWIVAAILDSGASGQMERPEAIKHLKAIYAMFIELPPDWRERRRAVQKRDSSKCRGCGKKFRSEHGFHIHHVIPKAELAGTHDLDNLILLCERCHTRIHPWMG